MSLRTLVRRAGSMVGPAVAVATVATLALLAFLGLGPRTGAYRAVTVLTASMGEFAPAGSVLISTPVPSTSVAVGDVITYRIPVGDHRVVTHRVVEVVEGGDAPVVRTRGDANDTPDPWLARLAPGPVWKGRFAVPGAGFAVSWLRQPWLQALLVRAVPLLLAVAWLRTIWRPGPRRRPVLGGAVP